MCTVIVQTLDHFNDSEKPEVCFPMEKAQTGSRKRKREEKIFQFESFCEPGHPIQFNGSFNENVKALVAFGHQESVVREGMKCWSFQLDLHQYPSTCMRLFIAEEAVGMSLYRHCHYCRSVGWGHHMICNKRFHFLLPSNGSKLETEKLSSGLSTGFKRRQQQEKSGSKLIKSSQGQYLMHGVVHGNGFGHLIAVNGIEGGSDLVTGHQIMDLWDRICTALQLRKVSISDAAKKGNMELRLIHGLAYGQPWFSHWGYKFGQGTFGVTPQMYQNSLESLRTLPLFFPIPHFACIGREIPMIITKYQTVSGHNLLTLSDLIRFMIELSHRLPQNSPSAFDYDGLIMEPTCRWSIKRVEMATQVIVGTLKKSEFCWVTRQEVRDAARAYIGDTGLLDYVLKSLGNRIVGNYIIRRMVNPITKVLEYCLQDVSTVFPTFDQLGSVRFQVTRVQLMKDLFYLYMHILRAHSTMAVNGVFGAIPMAVRVILDAKHLVKDYNGQCPLQEIDEQVHIMCTIRVMGDQERKELLPYEIISLQPNATVSDLKREVEKKFREIYLGLKSFTAETVANVDAKDTDFVIGVIDSGNRVIVEGTVDNEGDSIYEGGRVVNCHCGAKEEDGEQMVCCDICDIWQHTVCAGVEDEEEQVPRVFLCSQCENNIAALPPIQY